MAESDSSILLKRFGRLTTICFSSKKLKSNHRYIYCTCECGKLKEVRESNLISGLTKSCGCLIGDVARKRMTKHGHRPNNTPTRTYSIWSGMLNRCLNKKTKNYSDYGGRGITVCDKWREFKNFLADMGQCPQGMSLERIDNNAGYEPSNCRWADKYDQANNKRSSLRIEYLGQTKTLAQWARQFGVIYSSALQKYRRGVPLDLIFSTIKP